MRESDELRYRCHGGDGCILVQSRYLFPRKCCEVGHNARRANHDRHIRPRREWKGQIDLWPDDRRKRMVLNVPHDTYDYNPIALKFIRSRGRVRNIELLPDGFAVRPELPGENIVYDRHVLVCGIIGFGKVPATE